MWYMRMKTIRFIIAAVLVLLAAEGYSKTPESKLESKLVKTSVTKPSTPVVTKSMLETGLARVNKLQKTKCYADSCEHIIGIPYVEDGNGRQVVDIYYAKEKRKNAVVIEVHGGFYVAGLRQNHRPFASVFLKEGYDVVLVEYRLVDGDSIDVSDQLRDVSAAADYVTLHAQELGLNADKMFISGSSAGGHLALYVAEGSADESFAIRPKYFKPRGVILSCPAYDYASFNATGLFWPKAMEWFLGPRYMDEEWMTLMSPRTRFSAYRGPLFVNTSRQDFLRSQALLILDDCGMNARPVEFVFIDSKRTEAGHVHNVNKPDLKESKEVNRRMIDFLERCGSVWPSVR